MDVLLSIHIFTLNYSFSFRWQSTFNASSSLKVPVSVTTLLQVLGQKKRDDPQAKAGGISGIARMPPPAKPDWPEKLGAEF